MARNGYIPESLAKRCQAEPVLLSVATSSPVKTRAPAAIGTVFDELKQHGTGRFGVEDLFQGRISVHSTVDERVQTIVNQALENGLALYEKRYPGAKGLIQGDRVTAASGEVLYEASRSAAKIDSTYLSVIQEGLRGVVRLPEGTAHALNNRDFPIPVMGKTGTTSDFRDALFVGSTYGPQGVTVAVRVGFDDNRALGEKETGGRTALPIFREIMLRIYERRLVGPVPSFPREIEEGITQYLVRSAARQAVRDRPPSWPTVEIGRPLRMSSLPDMGRRSTRHRSGPNLE
jgi:membrane carboxypeptidase/penicillin-binding protein